MKFHQPRLEPVHARLLVDRPRQAAVAHGIGGARVGVARRRDGGDGRDVLALGRLLAERIAPLVVAERGLDDPRRFKRRLFRLGADVVQHHEQDELAVGVGRRRLAVGEAVEDKRASVDEPALPIPDARGVRQERGPGVLRCAVLVRRLTAVIDHGLLAHDQRRLAVRGEAGQIVQKFRHVFLFSVVTSVCGMRWRYVLF